MNRDPRYAQPIPSQQLDLLANELETLAKTLRACGETASSQPGQVLAIYYWASAETGLKRLASFVRAADESRRSAVIGKPITTGALKPRSTALQPNPKKVEETRENYQKQPE
jgi:hypothetical protein